MYQQMTFRCLCEQNVAIEKVLNVGSRSPKQILRKETRYVEPGLKPIQILGIETCILTNIILDRKIDIHEIGVNAL